MSSLTFQNRSSASAAACGMECGVAAGGYAAPPAHPALSPTERSPAKSGLHVNFSDKGEVDIDELLDMDSDDLRRRHLTVSAPPRPAPRAPPRATTGDTILTTRCYCLLQTLLADAKKPQKDVHKFINDLLERAKTL
ncbi:hypothetical protein HF086_007206 [Spodoptera exigua]|uniref:Uncharacterized protein n=1 Tax=Spodoptera exigua TaxID=7107 RepID=A0A922MRU2_SPOEX|nr:hypothetical protein HF086_007206 [Spodoptera exigua]